MAMLPQSLRTLSQSGRPLRRALSSLPRETCAGGSRPPCPPCEPKPPQPCRASPETHVRGFRVTCCPPKQRAPLPCEPDPRACSLTCANRAGALPDPSNENAHAKLSSQDPSAPHDKDCGVVRDAVTSRLKAAWRSRRDEYLRDTACRSPVGGGAVPDAPYRLPGERECVCATDGRQYQIKGKSPPKGAACGPCRQPPPPRCVELVPDDNCQIKSGRHLNPCAHQPRVIVEIDRSGQKPGGGGCAAGAGAGGAPTGAVPANPCAPRSASGTLTSRIMKSLNIGSGSGSGKGKKCPAPSCGSKCPATPGAAKQAGDNSWCASIKRPTVPPLCRELNFKERLGRRPAPRCKPTRRSLHLSSAVSGAATGKKPKQDIAAIVEKTKADSEKLAKTLKARAGLKEAGVGRSAGAGVTDCKKAEKRLPPISGRLDLKVPMCNSGLRIAVLVDENREDEKPGACKLAPQGKKAPPGVPGCSSAVSPPSRCPPSLSQDKIVRAQKADSWLSMKNIISACCGKGGKGDKCSPKPKVPASPGCKPPGGGKGKDDACKPKRCPAPKPTPRPGRQSPCEAPTDDPCKPNKPVKPRDPCRPTPCTPNKGGSASNQSKCCSSALNVLPYPVIV